MLADEILTAYGLAAKAAFMADPLDARRRPRAAARAWALANEPPPAYTRERWEERIEEEIKRVRVLPLPDGRRSYLAWAVWCVQDQLDLAHEHEGYGAAGSYLGSPSILADLEGKGDNYGAQADDLRRWRDR